MDCAESLGINPANGSGVVFGFIVSQLHNSFFKAMRKTQSENDSWKKIEAIIARYKFQSVNAFACHLGLNRAENLFQIKRGNNRISRELAENICALFPEVSKAWLMTGENQMLKSAHDSQDIMRKIIEIPFYAAVPENPDRVNPNTILYCSKEIVNSVELATTYRGNALLPTYKSGAILFMNRWGLKDELIYGDVYYIRTVNFSKFRIIRKERAKVTYD